MIEDPQRVSPGRAGLEGFRALESCAFTWIFDGATLRYRRVPRYAYTSFHVPTAWTPYCRLEIDESRSCFVVALDEAGTRLLRVWLHAEPCDRCRPQWRTGAAEQHLLWWKSPSNAIDRRSTAARLGRNPLHRPFAGWLDAAEAS
jgi:hypothetical protein